MPANYEPASYAWQLAQGHIQAQPRATSKLIMTMKPMTAPQLAARPLPSDWASGMMSSTTTYTMAPCNDTLQRRDEDEDGGGSGEKGGGSGEEGEGRSTATNS